MAEDDFPEDEPTDFFPKALAGRFVLGRPVGATRRTTTFEASDQIQGGKVAVKMLNASLIEDDKARRRFENEGRIMTLLNHPNVGRVLEINEDKTNDQPFMVLELVDGVTLGQARSKGYHFSTIEAVDVVLDVLAGLAALHQQGHVHRDIQPQNILLHPDGRAILGDFGSVKLRPEDEIEDGVTDVHEQLGQYGFVPNEQRGDAREVTRHSDVYSAGAVLFWMLSENRVDDLGTVSMREAAMADLPGLIVPIVRRSTAFHPHERYDSSIDMARDLLTIRDGIARETGKEPRGELWLNWIETFEPHPMGDIEPTTLGTENTHRKRGKTQEVEPETGAFRRIGREVSYQADQFVQMADRYPFPTAVLVTSLLGTAGMLIYSVL